MSTKFKFTLVVASTLMALTAFAQSSLGTVAEVQGIVTYTDGGNVGTAVLGGPVDDGMSFVTTSSGFATLQLKNGCVIKLEPNQAVTIRDKVPCAALLAGIQPVGGGSALAGGGGFAGRAIGGGALLGVAPLIFVLENRSTSSN